MQRNSDYRDKWTLIHKWLRLLKSSQFLLGVATKIIPVPKKPNYVIGSWLHYINIWQKINMKVTL
jgi:hypothetical protein